MAKGFKTGGRQAGQPNKLTADIRALLSDIVRSEIENLPNLLKQLEPKERAATLEKFTGYVIPKMQSEEAREASEPIIVRIAENI